MIRAFKPCDVSDIDLSDEHRLVAESANVRGVLDGLSASRWTTTSVSPRGEILAILGLVVGANYADGCEVFIFPSRAVERHPRTLFKDVADELARIRQSFPVVHAITRHDPKANRFLAHLGFERAGVRGALLVWSFR